MKWRKKCNGGSRTRGLVMSSTLSEFSCDFVKEATFTSTKVPECRTHMDS